MNREEYTQARAAAKAARTDIRTKAEALLSLCQLADASTDDISKAAHGVHEAAELAGELAKVAETATVTE